MTDRLTLYLAKSTAKWLDDNVTGLDKAYVVNPDFDYDKKPSSSDPSLRIKRDLPFVGISMITENSMPFSASKNILYSTDIEYHIEVYADGFSALLNMTGDVKQQLKGAKHPVSNDVGVPLYDFATASGTFFDLVGTVDIMEISETTYFGPDDVAEFENRKHRSITPIIFSAFKDKDAVLLENLGNININD